MLSWLTINSYNASYVYDSNRIEEIMHSVWLHTNQAREINKLSNIMISPTRIEILNKLSKSDYGMSEA